VAVTTSILDRKISSRAESCRKKMSVEDFRVAEKFCASMPDCSSLLLFF
jgi:hypothetical protein